MSRRQFALFGLLATTALAAYVAPVPGDVIGPTRGTTAGIAGPQAKAAASVIDLEQVVPIRPRTADEEMPPVFATETWSAPRLAVPVAPPQSQPVHVPAPQPQPMVLPPPSQAPPLPFKAFGRYLENGKSAVFVQHNDRNLVVRPGDSIDDQYLVEGIDEGVVTLLHIQLNQRQTLNIGSAP